MICCRTIVAALAVAAATLPTAVQAQYSATVAPSAMELAEEARKEREREDRAQATRLAASERAAEVRRLREERIAKCIIKPVMTDAEIDYCRHAAR